MRTQELSMAQEMMAREKRVLRKDIRGDPGSGLDLGKWIYVIVGVMVLVIVVSALLGPLNTQLRGYALNDTTFGPVLKTLVPILIGAAILIAIVAALIVRRRGGMY